MLLDERVHDLLSQWEHGGRSRTPEQLCAGCPELLEELRRRIQQLSSVERLLGTGELDDEEGEAARTPPQIAGYEVSGVCDFIGEGGMGTVWRARQLSTNRTVALKVMSAAGLCSTRGRERFRREIELASRLEHAHVARVYDGDVQRGNCYIAQWS
jgi:eukaryotic-like serine/threonine-protein kinase